MYSRVVYTYFSMYNMSCIDRSRNPIIILPGAYSVLERPINPAKGRCVSLLLAHTIPHTTRLQDNQALAVSREALLVVVGVDAPRTNVDPAIHSDLGESSRFFFFVIENASVSEFQKKSRESRAGRSGRARYTAVEIER